MFGLSKQKLIPMNSITRLEKIDKKIIVTMQNVKKIRKVCDFIPPQKYSEYSEYNYYNFPPQFNFSSSQEAGEVFAIAHPIWTTALSQQNSHATNSAFKPQSPASPPPPPPQDSFAKVNPIVFRFSLLTACSNLNYAELQDCRAKKSGTRS